jgi:hypothetical protein
LNQLLLVVRAGPIREAAVLHSHRESFPAATEEQRQPSSRRLGVSPFIGERVINHSKDVLEETYDLWDYFETST